MAFIDYETRDIHFKVVLYGPAGSGKSSALQYIYDQTAPTPRSLRAASGLPDDAYYDMLPLKLGEIRGFTTQIDLWTVPGAADLGDARRSMLEGVDGIVFVADSRPIRMPANKSCMEELTVGLRSHDFELEALPFVVACAHADAPNAALPREVAKLLLRAHPQCASAPVFAVDAVRGDGVFDAVKMVTKQALSTLKRANESS